MGRGARRERVGTSVRLWIQRLTACPQHPVRSLPVLCCYHRPRLWLIPPPVPQAQSCSLRQLLPWCWAMPVRPRRLARNFLLSFFPVVPLFSFSNSRCLWIGKLSFRLLVGREHRRSTLTSLRNHSDGSPPTASGDDDGEGTAGMRMVCDCGDNGSGNIPGIGYRESV